LVPTTGNYFHLHLVSDSTGETLITVARAVAAQYANVTAVEHVYPLVRSQKQLDRVLAEIEEAPRIWSAGWRPSAGTSTSQVCRSLAR
jgi:regulator of PEP synthase PpsR (kinase-PPPase family)